MSIAEQQQQQQQQVLATPTDDPTRVAVENLIASIKSKQLQESQRQSDRKILDIIHRVLGRTVELVYDEDEKEKVQEVPEQQVTTEVQKTIPMIIEEEDITYTPRAPDVSRIDINIDDGSDQEDEDIDEQAKTIDTIKPTDIDEEIDMSNDPLYRHILLGISKEDILNVRGSQINVPISLIRKNQSLPIKSIKHDDKSIHHFCIQMLDEKHMMSKEIRSITQLYHQRARYRHQLPVSSIYHKHGKLPNFPIKETREHEEDGQKM